MNDVAQSADNEPNLPSCSKKRRRSYIALPEDENDPLPSEMRYVRTSEKKVRDEIYLALTDLLGIGLSANEALQAVAIVSNRVFGRSFHTASTTADGTLETINQNSLPDERSVRDMAERVEAHGLHAIADEIQTRSKAGDVITHACDSTTKRHVGKFSVAGIHLNRDEMIPLPTVPVAGEAREEVAQQAALGFEILAAAREPPITAAELYKEIDVHMTDSVSHNKFLSEDIPKLFNLNHKPGQLFCSVHTNLGFCAALNSSIHEIEVKHGLNNIMDGFIVDIDYESKNGSCVGQFVDCMCRLVGSELKHKPWNCSKDFKNYCRDQL